MTENVEIRVASASDIDSICRLEDGFGDERYSRELILSSLGNENVYNILILVDGAIKGYLTANIVLDESEILKIIVEEDYRGKGLGSILMTTYINEMMCRGIDKIYLEVRKDNIPAKRLYEKFGFKKIYQREKYYSDGMDAEVYWYSVNVSN